jgi:hypothetical protein
MDKRVMILVADGLVFQRGKALNLPASINEEDAKALHVADVSLLVPEDHENSFQVIALPIPGTDFAKANKGIVVDIPERKTDLIVYDTTASEAEQWIKEQIELDRRKAEEDLEAQQDDDEDDEEEEEEDENGTPPPVLEMPVLMTAQVPAALPPAPAAPPAPAMVVASMVGTLAPEQTGQLEVLAPIPLQFPTDKQEG